MTDPNAPMPAEVLAMAGRVPTQGLTTQMVWLAPEPPRVGFALVAYERQNLRLAEIYGRDPGIRDRIQASVDDCETERVEHPIGDCLCCFSCLVTARNAHLDEKVATIRVMRVSQPADGPVRLDANRTWERRGRLLMARMHWVDDRDGDGHPEVDVSTTVAPGPGEGCSEAGIHEHILDGDTLDIEFFLERDTELQRDNGMSLSRRFDVLARDENGDGLDDFVLHEARWSGEPYPPDVMPDGEHRVDSFEAVQEAFEAGEVAWWDDRYVLVYDPAANRYVRQ